MLTIEELYQLMTDIESDRIERTTSTHKTDKFAQTVCVFANDLPQRKMAIPKLNFNLNSITS